MHWDAASRPAGTVLLRPLLTSVTSAGRAPQGSRRFVGVERGGEVRLCVSLAGCGASWQVGTTKREVARQRHNDLAPQVAVHQQSVHEDRSTRRVLRSEAIVPGAIDLTVCWKDWVLEYVVIDPPPARCRLRRMRAVDSCRGAPARVCRSRVTRLSVTRKRIAVVMPVAGGGNARCSCDQRATLVTVRCPYATLHQKVGPADGASPADGKVMQGAILMPLLPACVAPGSAWWARSQRGVRVVVGARRRAIPSGRSRPARSLRAGIVGLCIGVSAIGYRWSAGRDPCREEMLETSVMVGDHRMTIVAARRLSCGLAAAWRWSRIDLAMPDASLRRASCSAVDRRLSPRSAPAQLGLRPRWSSASTPGGVCPQLGCIPTKVPRCAPPRSRYQLREQAKLSSGFEIDGVRFDVNKAVERLRCASDRLSRVASRR